MLLSEVLTGMDHDVCAVVESEANAVAAASTRVLSKKQS